MTDQSVLSNLKFSLRQHTDHTLNVLYIQSLKDMIDNDLRRSWVLDFVERALGLPKGDIDPIASTVFSAHENYIYRKRRGEDVSLYRMVLGLMYMYADILEMEQKAEE